MQTAKKESPSGGLHNPQLIATLHLKGDPRRTILCFPGFSTFSWVWKTVATHLNAHLGCEIYCRNMARHDTESEFRHGRSWHWLKKAEEDLLEVWEASAQNPIIIAGFSTSALIAKILARRHPEKVKALILVGPALLVRKMLLQIGMWVGMIIYLLLFPLARWIEGFSISLSPSEGRSVVTEEIRQQPTHTRYFIFTASSILYLQVLARFALRHIRCPTLLLHGALDELVDPAVSSRILQRLRMPPKRKRHYVLDRSPHAVTLGEEAISALTHIKNFLEDLWNGNLD